MLRSPPCPQGEVGVSKDEVGAALASADRFRVSAAARERAARIGEHERTERAVGMLDIGLGQKLLGWKIADGQALLHEEGLDIEHAGDVDAAVRAARRPG